MDSTALMSAIQAAAQRTGPSPVLDSCARIFVAQHGARCVLEEAARSGCTIPDAARRFLEASTALDAISRGAAEGGKS